MGFLKDISTNPAKHPNKKNENLLCDAIAIAEGSRSCLYHICDDQNKCMAHDPNLVQGIGNFASLSFAHKICIGWSLSNSKSCCDSIFDMNLPKSINQENMRKQSITQTSRSKMVSKKARAAAACAGLGGPGPRGWIILNHEAWIDYHWAMTDGQCPQSSTTGTCKAGLRGNTRSELIDLCWDVKHEHTLRRGGLYIKRFLLALFCCAWLVILGGSVVRHVPAVEMAASKALAAILQQTHKWS